MSGFCPGCGEEVGYGDLFCEFCGAVVSPSVVTTRVRGTFNGWSGDTVVALETGERWQQASDTAVACRLERPRAWLYPVGSGYVLKVEGVQQPVDVKPAPVETKEP